MKIRIFDNAKFDLANGYYFYDRQKNGLGQYFLDCLYSDIDSLVIYAGIHAQKAGFYWMLSKRFPYAIYYTLEDDYISVHAVIDCRQNPTNIEQRLQEEREMRW